METARPRVLAALGLAVAAISTAAVLIRLAEAPALVIAFWRLAMATAILAPAAVASPATRDELADLPRRDRAVLVVVGVVLAVHFAAWIRSLELTSVAASVVLVTIHPVIVGLASAWLFDEGLGGAGWAGVGLALLGSVVLAYGDYGLGGHRLLGDLLALLGAGAAAAYFLAGRGLRRSYGLLTYVVPVYAVASGTLLAFALAAGQPLLGWPATDYVLFLALAIVPMIFGHTVLNWALEHVTAPVVATAILGEPVGAALLAWAVLGEVPPVVTILGGAIVLAGIGVVAYARHDGSSSTW